MIFHCFPSLACHDCDLTISDDLTISPTKAIKERFRWAQGRENGCF